MKRREIINNKMRELSDYIRESNVKLNEEHSDGRINSITNEKSIIEIVKKFCLENDIDIDIPTDRHWYDIALTISDQEMGEIFVPINIKITNLDNNSADNASSWKGLFWTFYNELDVSNFEKMFNIIKNTKFSSIEEIENDYYYLVVGKGTQSKVFFNSIKQLPKVVKNSNNLPFQIKWADCEELKSSDNFIEVYERIFSPIYEALLKLEIRIKMGNKLKEIIEVEKQQVKTFEKLPSQKV